MSCKKILRIACVSGVARCFHPEGLNGTHLNSRLREKDAKSNKGKNANGAKLGSRCGSVAGTQHYPLTRFRIPVAEARTERKSLNGLPAHAGRLAAAN